MKLLIACTGALLLSAATAWGQSGLNFFLNDCYAGGAGSSLNHVVNACTTNSGAAFQAVGSVVLPTHPVVPGFVGTAQNVDVQTALDVIPDWWRGDACRSGAFRVAENNAVSPSCPTIWDGPVNPYWGVFVYTAANSPTVSPSRIRIAMACVVATNQAFDLVGDGTTELGVFKLSVSNQKSTGAGSCTGCSQGACLVLNEMSFQPLVGDETTWLRVTNPLQGNYLVYGDAGAPACNASTPTRNRSWGAVKAMYR